MVAEDIHEQVSKINGDLRNHLQDKLLHVSGLRMVLSIVPYLSKIFRR